MILHTNITGEGEPFVLIHSGGMTGLTEYEAQSEYFSGLNFKVIRPDLRGMEIPAETLIITLIAA